MILNFLSKNKYAIIFWLMLWLLQSLLMSGGTEVDFYLVKNIVIVGLQFLVVQLNLKMLFPVFFDKQKYLPYILLSGILVYLVFSLSYVLIDLVFSLYYPNFKSILPVEFQYDFWRILSGSSFYSLTLVCSLVYKLLQKNQDKETKNLALEKKLISASATSKINIKDGHRVHQLLAKDVYFIKGLKEYVVWHTTSKNIVALQTLSSIENDYQKMGFLRVHKSYIVNMKYVSSFEKNNLYVQGEIIPVGRAFKKNVFDFFNL